MRYCLKGKTNKCGSVFSSTKHKGMGIGLESVKEIVNKYGGIIDISDTNDLFTVSFAISTIKTSQKK